MPRLRRWAAQAALGKDLKAAQAADYAAVGKIHFDSAHFRRDIAAKAFYVPMDLFGITFQPLKSSLLFWRGDVRQ
jgi:hypothetical protein